MTPEQEFVNVLSDVAERTEQILRALQAKGGSPANPALIQQIEALASGLSRMANEFQQVESQAARNDVPYPLSSSLWSAYERAVRIGEMLDQLDPPTAITNAMDIITRQVDALRSRYRKVSNQFQNAGKSVSRKALPAAQKDDKGVSLYITQRGDETIFSGGISRYRRWNAIPDDEVNQFVSQLQSMGYRPGPVQGDYPTPGRWNREYVVGQLRGGTRNIWATDLYAFATRDAREAERLITKVQSQGYRTDPEWRHELEPYLSKKSVALKAVPAQRLDQHVGYLDLDGHEYVEVVDWQEWRALSEQDFQEVVANLEAQGFRKFSSLSFIVQRQAMGRWLKVYDTRIQGRSIISLRTYVYRGKDWKDRKRFIQLWVAKGYRQTGMKEVLEHNERVAVRELEGKSIDTKAIPQPTADTRAQFVHLRTKKPVPAINVHLIRERRYERLSKEARNEIVEQFKAKGYREINEGSYERVPSGRWIRGLIIDLHAVYVSDFYSYDTTNPEDAMRLIRQSVAQGYIEDTTGRKEVEELIKASQGTRSARKPKEPPFDEQAIRQKIELNRQLGVFSDKIGKLSDKTVVARHNFEAFYLRAPDARQGMERASKRWQALLEQLQAAYDESVRFSKENDLITLPVPEGLQQSGDYKADEPTHAKPATRYPRDPKHDIPPRAAVGLVRAMNQFVEAMKQYMGSPEYQSLKPYNQDYAKRVWQTGQGSVRTQALHILDLFRLHRPEFLPTALRHLKLTMYDITRDIESARAHLKYGPWNELLMLLGGMEADIMDIERGILTGKSTDSLKADTAQVLNLLDTYQLAVDLVAKHVQEGQWFLVRTTVPLSARALSSAVRSLGAIVQDMEVSEIPSAIAAVRGSLGALQSGLAKEQTKIDLQARTDPKAKAAQRSAKILEQEINALGIPLANIMAKLAPLYQGGESVQKSASLTQALELADSLAVGLRQAEAFQGMPDVLDAASMVDQAVRSIRSSEGVQSLDSALAQLGQGKQKLIQARDTARARKSGRDALAADKALRELNRVRDLLNQARQEE